MISVVVPTIDGREEHLERCLDAYKKNTVNEIQLIIVKNKPAVGIAWNEGVKSAVGKYIHLTADDLEPQPGWDVPAVEAADKGMIPHPQVFTVNGNLDDRYGDAISDWQQVEMSTIPFMTKEMWYFVGPSLNIHLFTDDWFSWKAKLLGYPTVVRKEYKFIHHYAQVGRGAGMTEMQRFQHDQQVFNKAKEAYYNGTFKELFEKGEI
jgi:glycosyltransferase involved in cell wall biosynthesis